MLSILSEFYQHGIKQTLFGFMGNGFEKEALDAHNAYRKEHGVPPLVLNKDMCKTSQKWAEKLAEHDGIAFNLDKNYGENVYCGWPEDPNHIRAKDYIDKWYSEIVEYSFGEEIPSLYCNNFTQIIWRETKELGIGCAVSKSGKLYIVANYYPPGNISGKYAENVMPPNANRAKSPVTPRNLFFGSGGENFSNFEEECLQAHNEYRKKHQAPPLKLNKKLSNYAQEWANTLLKEGKMHHRNQREYGENIFFAISSDPKFTVSGRKPVETWYSEIKDHKFGKEPTNLTTGHFTQVVWEDTKEMGVAKSEKNGHVYVVANYFPPGNIMGKFAKNVKPPS